MLLQRFASTNLNFRELKLYKDVFVSISKFNFQEKL